MVILRAGLFDLLGSVFDVRGVDTAVSEDLAPVVAPDDLAAIACFIEEPSVASGDRGRMGKEDGSS